MSRFSQPPDPLFQALNSSIAFDYRLAPYDLEQSIAHVRMLARCGIVSEDDLAQMDERQNPADSFEYDNLPWQYELSREVRGWRDNQPQPATFYYWEFRTQDRKRLLGIRKAEGEPFTVTEYAWISPADVTVYRGRS